MTQDEISRLINDAITSQSDVRLVAQRLMQLGEAGVAPMMEIIYRGNEHQRLQISHFIWEVGETMVKTLLEALDHPDSQVRRFAAWNLGHLTHYVAEPPIERLIELLEEPDITMRWSIIYALGHFGDARAIEPIRRQASYPDADIRRVTAEALGLLTRKVVASMPYDEALTMLDSPDQNLKYAAIESLGETRKPEVAEPLIRLFKSSINQAQYWTDFHHQLVRHIISALGKIGSPEAIDFLITLLDHPDKGIVSVTLYQLFFNKHRQSQEVIEAIFNRPEVFQHMQPETLRIALEVILSSQNTEIFKQVWREREALFNRMIINVLFFNLLYNSFPAVGAIFASELTAPVFNQRLAGVIFYHDFKLYYDDSLREQWVEHPEDPLRWEPHITMNFVQPLINALRSEAGKGEAVAYGGTGRTQRAGCAIGDISQS